MGAVSQQAIATAVSNCAPSYGLRSAYLFGSYARGSADDASDIDICIEYDEGFDLFRLGGLGYHLEEALGRPVDIVCGEGSFYPKAKERYMKDRVLLYERA